MSGDAPSNTDSAEKNIRETTKWLLTTFGAITAVLVAGLSLSSLGDVTVAGRVTVAIGLAVAVLGVVWAVHDAAAVLVVPPVKLADLATAADSSVAGDPTVLGPASSLDELAEETPNRQRAAHDAYDVYLQAAGSGAGNVQDLRSAYEAAENSRRQWHRAAISAVAMLRQEKVIEAFDDFRSHLPLQIPLVLAGIMVVGLGLAARHATETPGGRVPAVLFEPVVVDLVLDDVDGPAAEEVGAACVASGPVRAVVLDNRGDSLLVAIVPTRACTAAIVDLERAAVVLAPADG